MKKLIKCLVIMMMLAVAVLVVSETDTYAAVKSTLKNGILTISGEGKMPKSMTFRNNKKIKKVVIKKGITSISDTAFYECENLEEVKIAKTVNKIGSSSFEGTGLKAVTIPSSVKKIGNGAFNRCGDLENVTMPGNFKVLKEAPEEDSIVIWGSNLKTVNFNTNYNPITASRINGLKFNVKKNDPKYKSINGIVYTKDGERIVTVPRDIKKLVIEEGCEVFSLESIAYPDGVDESPLKACSSLEEIVIPETVKYVDDENCEVLDGDEFFYLSNVVVNTKLLDEDSINILVERCSGYSGEATDSLKSRISQNEDFLMLDNDTIIKYTGTEENVVIPEGIKAIACNAFYSFFTYSNVKKVVLPESLELLGENVFEDCTKLEEVILPDTLEVIPKKLFYGCKKLEKVNVPQMLKKIKVSAFNGTNVDIQQFLDCKSLTKIEKNAFRKVDWTTLNIPKNIKKIEENVFYNNKLDSAQRSVTIEGSAKNIHKNAFGNSRNKKITFEFIGNFKYSFTEVNAELVYGRKKVNVFCKKVKEADGYEIRLYSDKKYKKLQKKKVTKNNKRNITIKLSKKQNNIFVKVRPYKIVKEKKVYGRWNTDRAYYRNGKYY